MLSQPRSKIRHLDLAHSAAQPPTIPQAALAVLVQMPTRMRALQAASVPTGLLLLALGCRRALVRSARTRTRMPMPMPTLTRVEHSDLDHSRIMLQEQGLEIHLNLLVALVSRTSHRSPGFE